MWPRDRPFVPLRVCLCERSAMSPIHTWICLLFSIGFTTQDKLPDTDVTCVFSEDCVLPCTFQPSGNEVVRWFRQDVLVHSFLSDDSKEEDEDSEEQSAHEQYAGRTSLIPDLVVHGNATLVLKGCGPKDRGRYRCYVRTSSGVHESHVIVKVEAPLRSLILVLSRLSGYEEMKCTARHVYPAPHVTWATDPPESHALKPITRKMADKQGLYTVESRVKRLRSHPEITYICKVSSSYGTQSWIASLRERAEISGPEGRAISIPCHAPPYLRDPSLSWTFTSGKDPAHILTYDSLSQQSSVSMPWEGHTELDAYRVPFGDGSLRLLDPDHADHTGVYTCVYSSPYKTHTEETEVTISAVGERLHPWEPSHWWIVALVIAVLVLALVALLAYLKAKGSHAKPGKKTEQPTEMHLVKEMIPGESSPLTVPDAKGQTSCQSDTSLA